jgi:type IV secretory pathway VirB2 component (pilin)
MIFAVLILAALLISSGLKGTEHELAQQLQQDIIGPQGFAVWVCAIVAIGALGYIPGLQKSSRYLLLLIAVVILVQNQNVFAALEAGLQAASSAGPAAPVAVPQSSGLASPGGTSTAASSGGSSGSSGGGILSAIGPALGIVGALL